MNLQETKRQILHILIGIFFLLLIVSDILRPLYLFILLILSGFAAVLSLKYRLPVVNFFLEKFERKNSELPGKGFVMFLAGILLALELFPREIALASVIILTFLDPVSHFIGENFGKTRDFFDKKKNIEGHLAGFIVSSLFAMFFVQPCLAILGALAASFFESIIIEIQKIKLDDNLIIPLVAGTIMLIISMIL